MLHILLENFLNRNILYGMNMLLSQDFCQKDLCLNLIQYAVV